MAKIHPKILLIIPAFNERDNIGNLLISLREQQIEVLVVNDGSTDDTAQVCKELGAKIITLPCNLGIGGAVQTGYKYAFAHGYDIAIQFDGDGQHRAEFIPDLIAPILANQADLVIGSRYIEKQGFQSTAMRRVGIRYFSVLIRWIAKQTITDPTSGFRAANRRIIEIFAAQYPTDYPEPESIVHVLRLGAKVTEIPVQMSGRVGGLSSIRSLGSIYYMVKVSLAILIDALRGNGVRRS